MSSSTVAAVAVPIAVAVAVAVVRAPGAAMPMWREESCSNEQKTETPCMQRGGIAVTAALRRIDNNHFPTGIDGSGAVCVEVR